jgi:hypothetical protein
MREEKKYPALVVIGEDLKKLIEEDTSYQTKYELSLNVARGLRKSGLVTNILKALAIFEELIKFSESISDVNISIDCLYEIAKTYYCLIGKGES